MTLSGLNRARQKIVSFSRIQLARLRHARGSQVYCVGTARSGTHSIALMFDKTVRSRHEPEAKQVIRKILANAKGRIDQQELRRYVRKRDRRLYLEVDSSQLNFFLLEALVAEFENALFILTIRDCYSWLNSFINYTLWFEASKEWCRLRDLRFKRNASSHPLEERVLREHGLYTLEGYFSYWARHNQKVISTVPKKQLFIVRTDQITKNAHNIAEFSGMPESAIRPGKTHVAKITKNYGMLSKIDQDYLEMQVQRYCQPLMARFFPEIKSIKDVAIGTSQQV